MERLMRKLISVFFILGISSLVGCTSGAERAAEADADFKEEKIRILQKYQKCVEENQDDTKKLSTCEHYLKAIDAMK